MALRKQYKAELSESLTTVMITPFVNGLDNGAVTLQQRDENGNIVEMHLTYNDIAQLEGICFPQQSYDCNGNKTDNWATLSEEEREYMYSLYPETRPTVEIQETVVN